MRGEAHCLENPVEVEALCDTGAQRNENSMNSNTFRSFLQSAHVSSIAKEGQRKQQNLTIATQGFSACNCCDLLT